MTEQDIQTLEHANNLFSNQIAQLDQEIDGGTNQLAQLRQIQAALLSAQSVVEDRITGMRLIIPRPELVIEDSEQLELDLGEAPDEDPRYLGSN